MHVNLFEKLRFAVNLVFTANDIFDFHCCFLLEGLFLVDDFFFQCVHNLFRAGDYAAHAAEMLHGKSVVYGKTHVFHHLSGVKLHYEHAFLPFCRLADCLGGEARV